MFVALWSLLMKTFAFICASLLSVVLLKELFRSVLFIENRWVILITLFSSNDPVINSNDCGQRETDSSVITAFICDFWKESLFILPSITSTTTMTLSIQFHSTNSSMTSPSTTPALEAPLRICHHTWLQEISRNGWSSFRIQWWWLVRVRTTPMVRSTVCIPWCWQIPTSPMCMQILVCRGCGFRRCLPTLKRFIKSKGWYTNPTWCTFTTRRTATSITLYIVVRAHWYWVMQCPKQRLRR